MNLSIMEKVNAENIVFHYTTLDAAIWPLNGRDYNLDVGMPD